MAYVMNLYKDPLCTIPQKTVALGVAGITGYYANVGNWQNTGTGIYPMYRTYISNSTPADRVSGIVLSGGAAVFDYQFSTSDFFTDHARSDNKSNSDTTKIYNPFFISANHDVSGTLYSWYISMYAQKEGGTQQHAGTRFQLGRYTENPYGGTRSTWSYSTSGSPSIGSIANDTYNYQTSQYTCLKIFLLTIGSTKYYMFAYGIMADNTIGKSTNATMLILIPQAYFQDQPVAPYVGPVSKDSAAAFTPVIPHRDSIASRDLTGKKDPYGFNTGNGMKLVVATRETHAQLVRQIYTGYSGNILNALGQAVSSVVGGNDHRNAEEIQQMINCVLCCHLVPKITDSYSGTATTLYTLGGYALFNPAKAVNEVVSQIVEATTTPQRIDPIVNNFLSFAPYCQVSLSVPFVGDISIDPSAIFNSSIYFHFFIDLFTGTLSVDVHLVDDDGRDYIYATRQTNCAIDIPIMGTGATGNPLQKIASAAINGAHYGGAVGAGAGGIFQTVSEASAPHSAAIGRGSTSNMAPYFSCRRCYLVITYPESSNAANYFNLNGGVINKEGTIGDYPGYSEFEAVNLDGITATDQEKRQILELLKGGVFV